MSGWFLCCSINKKKVINKEFFIDFQIRKCYFTILMVQIITYFSYIHRMSYSNFFNLAKKIIT